MVLVIGGLIMWLNHAFERCGNDNLRPVVSPDGQLQAVLFRRSCTANAAFSTHISILRADQKLPNIIGNVFSAEGEPFVLIHWLDNTHLIINTPDGTNISYRVMQLGNVQISDH